MLAPWVMDEMKAAALPDKRLNARLMTILDQLAKRPGASIPCACGGYAETTAAYRFFDNDRVEFDDVLKPHVDATVARIKEQPLVILAQDTTELDLTRPNEQVSGTGPLDGSARRGLFLHLLHAFTPDGTPLGTARALPWKRPEEAAPRSKMPSHKRIAIPIEQKESHRWITTLEESQKIAAQLPRTNFVCVADSEADIYELIIAGTAQPNRVDWIVRACHDRVLVVDAQEGEGDGEETPGNEAIPWKLREKVLNVPVLLRQTIQVRERDCKYNCDSRKRRKSRKARTAEVEVRACRVTLKAPQRPQNRLPDISVNVVMVHEPNPPEGEEAVEWMLLTSLPIETLDQVTHVIQSYCVRWMIEVFFRTLKSGCRVEDRRFEEAERFLPCLATYLIVTWRTLYVCRLGREFPDISCEAIFESAEWRSVYQVVHRQAPPAKAPTLTEMVRMVAQLGGYINRKRSDPPGPQTIWIGLQRLHDIALCWLTFGPGARKAEDV
jgi:hypothetical protein